MDHWQKGGEVLALEGEVRGRRRQKKLACQSQDLA